jgi:hypothetical protein
VGLDVDIIAGLNGLIWVSPHVPRTEEGSAIEQPDAAADGGSSAGGGGSGSESAAAVAAAAAAAAGPSREQREAVVRVAGAIRALAALMLQVHPASIIEAYKVCGGVCCRGVCWRGCHAPGPSCAGLSPQRLSAAAVLACPAQASLEEGVAVKDMTERPFLQALAQREVLRRTAEAAQAERTAS